MKARIVKDAQKDLIFASDFVKMLLYDELKMQHLLGNYDKADYTINTSSSAFPWLKNCH